ncbi:MAG: PKD domain-containing protein [Rudaea sp.]
MKRSWDIKFRPSRILAVPDGTLLSANRQETDVITSMDAKLRRIATSVIATTMALAFGCLAAGTAFGDENPYSPSAGHPYRHGPAPTKEAWQHMKEWATNNASPGGRAASKTLAYGGGIDGIGVTSGTPKIYLVVYGSQWGTIGMDVNGNTTLSNDAGGAVPYLQNVFKGVGTNGELWSGVMTQYCDGAVATNATTCPSSGVTHVGYPTGGAFAGIWYDNSAASPTQATALQLGQEAVKAAAHFGNTTAASNRYAQYVILSPSGTHPDGFGPTGQFCAWHDYNKDVGATSSYGDIAFTNMPYVLDLGASCGQNFVNAGAAGNLDGFSIVNGHEYAETITDQNPAGGWTNHSSGQENADECAWISSGQGASANVTMATGTFAMQSTWSNDTNECDISHAIVTGGSVGLTASFNSSAAGLTVTFTDTSTGGSGTRTYSWTFGDNQSLTTQSNPVVHAYSTAGSYTVTDKVTDSSGSSTATKLVTVTAPPVLTTIKVSPASASVQTGGTQQFTATGLDQFGQPVSPQPTFTWSVSGGGSISASGLFTAGATAGGPFTVTATSGGVSGTASVTVTSVPSDFSLSVSPTSQSVKRGNTATYTVTIAPANGFNGSVTLSLTGQPSGSTVTFTPNPATSTSTLTVKTLSSTTRKTYTLTVKGVSGSLSHTTTTRLTVTR